MYQLTGPSYFADPLQTHSYYSKIVVGLPSILSYKSHQSTEEYYTDELALAVVPDAALREVAHKMVRLSESHRGLNLRDVICARC